METEDILQTETGRRKPANNTIQFILCAVALMWTVIQIWAASPVQYWFASQIKSSTFLLDSYRLRLIHLTIAIFLAFTLFPAGEKSNQQNIPWYDWLLALCGVSAVVYNYVNYEKLAYSLGMIKSIDIFFATIGIIALAEAVRRTLGIAMAVLASIFIAYALFGNMLPTIIAHKGYGIKDILYNQWITKNGVFGVALNVSADSVFLFVLFGSLLEIAGAGGFFIKIAFALFGKVNGGAAKATIIASGLMAMVSGSSIATTITVGTLTIPFMKRLGFSAEKAGAIQVSAGINGQITPPVMGAAAILMAEFLSISYVEVIKYAAVPAMITYITLFYMVHLEAKKILDTPTDNEDASLLESLLAIVRGTAYLIIGIAGCIALYVFIQGVNESIGGYHVYIPGIRTVTGKYFSWAICTFLAITYAVFIKIRTETLKEYDVDKIDAIELMKADIPVRYILMSGLHYIIPIAILVWCLMIERMSAAFASYWASLSALLILLTQKHLENAFTGNAEKDTSTIIKQDFKTTCESFVLTAHNMISVAIATAAAGIIVGTISQTGVGLAMTEIIDHIAGDNIFITLFVTAIVCIILGMGMPTTACYIIVATLMAPVIRAASLKYGLDIPPIATHLFVFYFGLMADVTPPVGLASYAAAAVSKGNPIKTGVIGFVYNIRTMILPFIFIFDPVVILYNIGTPLNAVIHIITAIAGILIISSAMQGFMIVKNKAYETAIMAVVGFAILYPQAVVNKIQNPFRTVPMSTVLATEIDPAHYQDPKIKIGAIEKSYGSEKPHEVRIPITDGKGAIWEKLRDQNIVLHTNPDHTFTVAPKSSSIVLSDGTKITSIQIPAPQIHTRFIRLAAALALVLVILNQRHRRSVQARSATARA